MGPREVINLSFLSGNNANGAFLMKNHIKTKRILGYDDVVLFNSPLKDSSEPLVSVATYNATISYQYIKEDMIPITGDVIHVRDTVAKKLARVEEELRTKGYCLKVAYGYRHPDIQRLYFEARKAAIIESGNAPSNDTLDVYVHNFVAVPDIAGHPTGGALDLTLVTLDGFSVDMGTGIADYSDEERIQTYAKGLTDEQRENRRILHDAMVAEGFAPFYGEWWHFSYGDREWAAFYKKTALYGAVDFKTQ